MMAVIVLMGLPSLRLAWRADRPPSIPPAIRATAMACDANPYGKIFFGWLMGQMALAAGSVASRHCGGRAPVVAADGFSFTAPVEIGDE
eukprot:gene37119-44431_t